MEEPGVARHSFSRGQVVLLAACAAFLSFYVAGLLLRPSEEYLRIQSNLLYNLPALVALVLVSQKALVTIKQERWGWIAMATVLVSWLIADWLFSYYELVLDREAPFPGLADVFYTAGYASLLVALPLLAYPRRLVGNLRWLLDALLITTVIGAFEWELIIRPILQEGRASAGESALALSYPLWDLGLVAVVVGSILAWHGHPSARSSVLLMAFTTMAITDSLYSYGLVEGGYENVGNPLEVGWIAAYMLIGLAATISGNPEQSRYERRLPLSWLVFPYLLALPLPVVEGVRAATSERVDVLSLGASVVLLVAFLSHVHGSVLTTHALADERRKARIDSLTGALNHGGIVEEAEDRIASHPGSPFWLCMVDVDSLKHLNDSFGHRTGDRALKAVATCLRRTGGIVGRYGGDEFVVLFEPNGSAPLRSPEALLRSAIDGAFIEGEGDESIAIGASFGLAVYPEDGADLASLLDKADMAMYGQKHRKRAATPESHSLPATSLVVREAV